MAMLVWNKSICNQGNNLKRSLIWMYTFWSLITLLLQSLGKSFQTTDKPGIETSLLRPYAETCKNLLLTFS